MKKQYKQYLKSAGWARIRAIVLSRDKKCRICGALTNLQVHHKTYLHIFNEHVNLDDLVTLCNGCHEKQHGKSNLQNYNKHIILNPLIK